MPETELAWAAGFFDGEGCTTTDLSQKRIQVVIAQTNRTVLDRFCEAVGVGKVNGPYERKGNRKLVWTFGTTGLSNTQYLFSRIWPYLGDVKKEQARTKCISWAHADREFFCRSDLRLNHVTCEEEPLQGIPAKT